MRIPSTNSLCAGTVGAPATVRRTAPMDMNMNVKKGEEEKLMDLLKLWHNSNTVLIFRIGSNKSKFDSGGI
jgi:hypothetical protein